MIGFQNRINNKYFSGPIFSVTFAKNIIILNNPDFIIKFRFKSFRNRHNFFQSNQNNHY